MTYNVSSGTLNTKLYYTIPYSEIRTCRACQDEAISKNFSRHITNSVSIAIHGDIWLVGAKRHFQHKKAISCHAKIKSMLNILISDRKLKYVYLGY